MPALKVLLDAKGKIIGTAEVDARPDNDGPQATLVAGKGQRLVEVTVPTEVSRLEAGALHKAVAARHLPKKKA
jgi:hypothetical protein